MHQVKHLFEQICSMSNLHQAAIETLRGKRMTQPGARFFAVMEKEIPTLHDELSSGSYRHGPYHYFQIHEPKVRQVAAAQFRDRVVHHAIVRVLEPIFEKRFIEDSFACRVGKPIVVACPMSEEQRALQEELVERYERIRSQKVDPREDNALAITTDGRKLATDARMLSATAPDFPGSKVIRRWRRANTSACC
jgi:RNA-directed DNA polymerase